MEKPGVVRDGVLVPGALLIRWWMHGGQRVNAAPVSSAAPMAGYQFSSITPGSSLTIYSADERTLYVYQGAVTGNSHVNCSYRFRIARVGAPIERENCQIGSLLP